MKSNTSHSISQLRNRHKPLSLRCLFPAVGFEKGANELFLRQKEVPKVLKGRTCILNTLIN